MTQEEIASQPQMWRKAVELLPTVAGELPAAGERVAVIGCGTSYFIAHAVAGSRETGGHGETDAFVASEMPTARRYDRVVAISRSGTTTEVARCLAALPAGTRSLAISAVAETPVVEAAADAILLPFADEVSIVQTRFATTALALLRAHLGETLAPAIADAEAVLAQPIPADPGRVRALRLPRPRLDRRPGRRGGAQVPRGRTGVGRVLSGDGVPPRPDQRRRAGHARVVPRPTPTPTSSPTSAPPAHRWWRATSTRWPSSSRCSAQRCALAEAKGLDPDNPQHLTRSVVLG